MPKMIKRAMKYSYGSMPENCTGTSDMQTQCRSCQTSLINFTIWVWQSYLTALSRVKENIMANKQISDFLDSMEGMDGIEGFSDAKGVVGSEVYSSKEIKNLWEKVHEVENRVERLESNE